MVARFCLLLSFVVFLLGFIFALHYLFRDQWLFCLPVPVVVPGIIFDFLFIRASKYDLYVFNEVVLFSIYGCYKIIDFSIECVSENTVKGFSQVY